MPSSPSQYPLSLSVAQQTFRIIGAYAAAQSIVLACSSYPSEGVVSVEYQLAGTSNWLPVPKGSLLPLSGPIVLAVYGAIAGYRVTLAGVVGGAALSAWVAPIEAEGFPPGAFIGLRALTTQSYIEANVKNGVQYEASALNLAVAAGANIDICVTTGLRPVLIKLRKIDFNGARVEARVYKNTVFSGGTPITYYNMNLRNPIAGSMQAFAGAVVSNIGVEAGAPTFGIGSVGQGQSTSGSYATSGIERLLATQSNYLLRITNSTAAPQDISTYLSWYEGDTDLPT